MKKYLVLLIFVMQGTVGMLSVKELSDVLSSANAFYPPQFIPQTEEQKKICIDAIKMTNFTDFDDIAVAGTFCDITINNIPMMLNYLIENNYLSNAAALMSSAYSIIRNKSINDCWLIKDIKEQGKDITFDSVFEYLNILNKIPDHIYIACGLLRAFIKNQQIDLSNYMTTQSKLNELEIFLKTYQIYKKRKLLPKDQGERIKLLFLRKLKNSRMILK